MAGYHWGIYWKWTMNRTGCSHTCTVVFVLVGVKVVNQTLMETADVDHWVRFKKKYSCRGFTNRPTTGLFLIIAAGCDICMISKAKLLMNPSADREHRAIFKEAVTISGFYICQSFGNCSNCVFMSVCKCGDLLWSINSQKQFKLQPAVLLSYSVFCLI